jgi:hypothetical protein
VSPLHISGVVMPKISFVFFGFAHATSATAILSRYGAYSLMGPL